MYYFCRHHKPHRALILLLLIYSFLCYLFFPMLPPDIISLQLKELLLVFLYHRFADDRYLQLLLIWECLFFLTSFLKDIVTGHRISGWLFFIQYSQYVIFIHCLLASLVLVEKLPINLLFLLWREYVSTLWLLLRFLLLRFFFLLFIFSSLTVVYLYVVLSLFCFGLSDLAEFVGQYLFSFGKFWAIRLHVN